MASVATVASMQLLPPAPQQTPQLQLACSHSEVGACQLLPAARTHNLLDKLEWALAVLGVVLSCKPRLKLEFVITRHCPAAVSGYNECRRSTGRPTLNIVFIIICMWGHFQLIDCSTFYFGIQLMISNHWFIGEFINHFCSH